MARGRIVVVALAAAATAGAAGYATGAIPAADGTITACYKKQSGALRVIDAAKKKCGKGERRLRWNQRGRRGPVGSVGAPGVAGPKGDRGEPGPFPDGLPANRTLRGSWVLASDSAVVGEHLEVGVSFPFTLPAAPAAHFVANGQPSTQDCPGSLASPAAQPGHLCVYQSSVDIDATQEGVFDPQRDTASGAGSGNRFGFSVRVTAGAAVIRTSGTWAVTAAP